MQVQKTKLDGVLLIEPQVFEDHRDWYVETYNEDVYRTNGIDVKFVQDDISISRRHVLRGIHGDAETWKLISCHYGQFYLVVVNGDKDSSDFGKWQSFVLSDRNRHQVHRSGVLNTRTMGRSAVSSDSSRSPPRQFAVRSEVL